MKKLAILSHCILNQNIRAKNVAINDNVNKIGIFLLENNFHILQLLCPEIKNDSINRKKHGISYFLKNNTYIKVCEKIIMDNTKLIDSYLFKNNFVCFIGVQGSPTCNANIRGWRDLRGDKRGKKMRGLLAQTIHNKFPEIILYNINTGKYFENSFKKLKKNLEIIH